jgi:YVTN family beta-propeller protein
MRRIVVVMLLITTGWLGARVLMAGGAASSNGGLVLVVNQGDANVSVMSAAEKKQVATIAEDVTGVHGHEAAASPDGKTAYVPIYGSTGVGKPGIDGHEMLVIDIASGNITHRVDFGAGVRPHCVVYEPVSGMLYVTTELQNSVTIVDPKTLKIVGTIPTGQPESHMLAITADGARGYTSNVGPGTVSVLDMKARKTLGVIPVAAGAQRIAVSRDGSMVFTADQAQPRLAVIDAKANAVRQWVTLPAIAYGTGATLDGKWLLVTTRAGVAVVDLKTMEVAKTIQVPGNPQEVLLAPDGKTAYVSCPVEAKNGQVAVIDLGTWKVEALVEAGKFPDGLAWAGGMR